MVQDIEEGERQIGNIIILAHIKGLSLRLDQLASLCSFQTIENSMDFCVYWYTAVLNDVIAFTDAEEDDVIRAF